MKENEKTTQRLSFLFRINKKHYEMSQYPQTSKENERTQKICVDKNNM